MRSYAISRSGKFQKRVELDETEIPIDTSAIPRVSKARNLRYVLHAHSTRAVTDAVH